MDMLMADGPATDHAVRTNERTPLVSHNDLCEVGTAAIDASNSAARIEVWLRPAAIGPSPNSPI